MNITNKCVEMPRAAGLPALAYRVQGSGPTVLLVHGVGGDSRTWDAVVPYLSPQFRTICLDLRGHGRSGVIRAACDISDFTRDVIDVLDALNVQACRLVGFSLGATIAQSVALSAPERVDRLVLLGSVAFRNESERTRVTRRLQELRSLGLAHAAQTLRNLWFTDDFQKQHPELVEGRVKQLLECDSESYIYSYAVFANTDFAERLRDIRMPTLIVVGENDVAAPPHMAKLIHEHIARSELHILPRVRHSLPIEAADQVGEILRASL